MNDDYRVYRLCVLRDEGFSPPICDVSVPKGNTPALAAFNELTFFHGLHTTNPENSRPIADLSRFVLPDDLTALMLHIIAATGDS